MYSHFIVKTKAPYFFIQQKKVNENRRVKIKSTNIKTYKYIFFPYIYRVYHLDLDFFSIYTLYSNKYILYGI